MNSRPKGGTAVAASRKEPPDSLDFFPTPPWATRALFPLLQALCPDERDLRSVEDPCCGEGHMSEVLKEMFAEVFAADVFDYGGNVVSDYLGDGPRAMNPDWTVFNPPFNALQAFITKGLARSRVGVAALTRLQFLEGQARWRDLWNVIPPAAVALFTDRVAMHKGEWKPDGSTATAYCWVIWRKGYRGPTHLRWIEPGRKLALTRPTDVLRFAKAAPAPLLEEVGHG